MLKHWDAPPLSCLPKPGPVATCTKLLPSKKNAHIVAALTLIGMIRVLRNGLELESDAEFLAITLIFSCALIANIYFLAKLMTALEWNIAVIILLCIGFVITGIFAFLIVTISASSALRKEGIQVGLLGVDSATLKELKGRYQTD